MARDPGNRNKLRHEYQRVSEVILWGIIATHADVLKPAIADMIAKCPDR